MGVETVAVVNTPLTRAQLYFKYRPVRVLLAADPEAETHRAFRVPAGVLVENESEVSWTEGRMSMNLLLSLKLNPKGLPEPMNPFAAMETVNKQEGFEPNEADQQIAAAHGTQLTGHFLIDRQGIIRWAHIEAAERPEDLLQFPSEEEILRAARSL